MQILMHYNPHLQHQIDHANAFRDCGFDVTPDPYKPADVHVVSGPWFALRYWREHKHVLVLDRSWWGDPGSVSLGWLNVDGTRRFARGDAPRFKPEMLPWKTHRREDSCLILCDYGQDVSEIEYYAKKRFTTVRKRLHPADNDDRHVIRLEADLMLSDCAIGTSGTSLFDAIALGVPSICLDPKNEVAPVCANSVDDDLYRSSRDCWLHDMSYKVFTLKEIHDGTAWNLLKDIQ